MGRPSPARSARDAWIFLAVGTAASLGYLALESEAALSILYQAIGLAAVAATVGGARRNRPHGAGPWYAFAAGLGLWVLADAVYAIEVDVLGSEAFPSVADAFYVLGYFVLAAALVLLIRQSDRSNGVQAAIDAALVAATAGLVCWLVFFQDLLAEGGSLLAQTVTVAYPLFDIALVALLARLVFVPGRRTVAYRLLVVGVLFTLAADILYASAVLHSSYASDAALNVGWLVSYVAIGAAALHPTMARPFEPHAEDAPNAPRRLLLPAAALFTDATVIAVLAPSSGPGLGGVVAVCLGIAGLVFARFTLLVKRLDQMRGAAQRLLDYERTHNERLRELDRLKDTFVATVSHELRTPLTSIRGYLELVLDEDAGELNEQQRRFLSIVDRNSDRLLRLVGDLLFVAQVDAGRIALDRTEVDLASVAEECAQSARPAAERSSVELRVEVAPVPPFAADRARLAQLVDNLVSNALKFTPPDGRVTVRTRVRDGKAVLEVADTGIGIPLEEQARVFERFFRTSAASARAIQGTGLGLAVAKAIAESHDGAISVESAEHEGATFRVELPLGPLVPSDVVRASQVAA